MTVEFLPCGDTALAIQLGTEIDRTLNNRIMALRQVLDRAGLVGIVETVPSYRSLLVHYDPLQTDFAAIVGAVKPLMSAPEDVSESTGQRWTIPVCFDEDLGPDMAHVARQSGLSPAEIESHITGIEQHVYMIGFAPGQPYMGDLPEVLNLPRRDRPVTRIEKGSVVTATGLTMIYALANPTGWHVLGRTPVDIFHPTRAVPILLTPGDKVIFKKVARAEFDDLAAEAAQPGGLDMERFRAS